MITSHENRDFYAVYRKGNKHSLQECRNIKIQTEISQRKTIFNPSWTVTKVANELSSWSLSYVDISWLWPHVKCN